MIALSQIKIQQCNIVCRDISRVFDETWKSGLHYKTLQINLIDAVERILCNFVEDCTATIQIRMYLDPSFLC